MHSSQAAAWKQSYMSLPVHNQYILYWTHAVNRVRSRVRKRSEARREGEVLYQAPARKKQACAGRVIPAMYARNMLRVVWARTRTFRLAGSDILPMLALNTARDWQELRCKAKRFIHSQVHIMWYVYVLFKQPWCLF